jgi:hypothetical protein
MIRDSRITTVAQALAKLNGPPSAGTSNPITPSPTRTPAPKSFARTVLAADKAVRSNRR